MPTGSVQVYTDDDNLDVASYFCDDAFLKKYGRLTAFLLHQHWRLPTASSCGQFIPTSPLRQLETGRAGEGGTYIIVTEECGKRELVNLATRPPIYVPGVRLPDIADYLRASRPADHWTDALLLLWSQLQEPSDLPDDDLREVLNRVCWFPGSVMAYLPKMPRTSRAEARTFLEAHRKEMIYEKRLPNSNLCRVQTSEHFAQLCWLVANAPEWAWRRNVYNQWYLFDDCWASANSDLANGLLRFATRWDVLTPE